MFSTKYWKFFLYGLTVILVLLFQSHWLWSVYTTHKVDMMERTQFELQQILFHESHFNENLNMDVETQEEIQLLLTEKLASVIDLQKLIDIDAHIEFLDENDNPIFSHSKDERILDLSTIHTKMEFFLKEQYNTDQFVLFLEKDKEIQSFPKDQKFSLKNTTEPIHSVFQPSEIYYVHIKNVFFLVIGKMMDSILFSFVYLLLFLSTLYILLHNLKINKILLKNKQDFTHNVTHELKIPISTIQIAAEGFEKYQLHKDPESASKYIQTIQRASHRLSYFVDSILQHAFAENARINIKSDPVLVSEIVEEAIIELNKIIQNKEASIVVPHSSEKIYVKGNKEELKQVFLNLLENSIKYCVQIPRIEINWIVVKDNAEISIKDNGIGLPKKYTEAVFEPYFRVNAQEVVPSKGFGLGLSYVKSIVKNHHGKIFVKSSTSQGTILQLNLPIYE